MTFRPSIPFRGAIDPSVAEAFYAALGDVFRDPEVALRRFEGRAERHGWGSALRELRNQPRFFGRLQGSALLGPFPGGRRHRALSLLPELVRLAERYLAYRSATPRDSEPETLSIGPARRKRALQPWLRPAAAALASILAQ